MSLEEGVNKGRKSSHVVSAIKSDTKEGECMIYNMRRQLFVARTKGNMVKEMFISELIKKRTTNQLGIIPLCYVPYVCPYLTGKA